MAPPLVPSPARPGASPSAPAPSTPATSGADLDTYDPNAAANASSYSGAAGIFTIDDIATRYVTLYSVGRAQPHAKRLPGLGRQGGEFERANASTPSTLAGQMTVQEAMKYFVAMAYDPKAKGQWGNMQRALYMMGAYGSAKPGEVLTGTWNGVDDANALEWAVRGYLQASDKEHGAGVPITFSEFITNAVDGKQRAAKAAEALSPKDPFVNMYDDPKAVAAQVQQAAQASLGRNLTNEEVQHFVSEFRLAQEAWNKQRKTISQDTTGKDFDLIGGQSGPNLESAASGFVDEGHGTEAAAQDLGDYVSAIQQLLGTS